MSDGMALTIDAYMRELSALPTAIRRHVVGKAVAAGAAVIRQEAVARAPLWPGPVGKKHPPPGTLKRAIYQARLSDECSETLEVWKVDVRTGNRSKGRGANKGVVLGAYYAGWVERGHFTATPKGAGTKKARAEAGKLTGAVRWVMPQPFMRPAFDTKAQDALRAMQQSLDERLPDAVAAFEFVKARIK